MCIVTSTIDTYLPPLVSKYNNNSLCFGNLLDNPNQQLKRGFSYQAGIGVLLDRLRFLWGVLSAWIGTIHLKYIQTFMYNDIEFFREGDLSTILP